MTIGLFDSGIGGLTVLKNLKERYPHNDYVYYGDNINIPYGNKTKEELFQLSSKVVEFLISKKVDLIIIACGTISSNCYNDLKNKYKITIIDIITPTIKKIKENNYQDITVLATTRTINSHIFKNSLPNIKVQEIECPTLASLIENRKYNEIDIDKYLRNSISDNVVLGCTHYPLIKHKINKNCIDMADNIVLDINQGNSSIEINFARLDKDIYLNIKSIIDYDNVIIKESRL